MLYLCSTSVLFILYIFYNLILLNSPFIEVVTSCYISSFSCTLVIKSYRQIYCNVQATKKIGYAEEKKGEESEMFV